MPDLSETSQGPRNQLFRHLSPRDIEANALLGRAALTRGQPERFAHRETDYDANGNAIARQGSTISWSSYNYPITINAGSGSTAETVAFSYGPDRQRWQQMYTGNSTQETTNYIGGLLEVVASGSVTDYRHNINVAGEQIAVYSRKSSGTNTFSYLLSDHQASVASITNSGGAQVVGESFDAFGNRRNPSTWSGAPSNSDLTTIAGITREGYTFQTALGLWMGMNHMNGRVEDSITGRMLSADPHIPGSSNPQSYNRYSYANNNPVTLADPSGFSACTSGVQWCKPVDGVSPRGTARGPRKLAAYDPGSLIGIDSFVGSLQGMSVPTGGSDSSSSDSSGSLDLSDVFSALDAATAEALDAESQSIAGTTDNGSDSTTATADQPSQDTQSDSSLVSVSNTSRDRPDQQIGTVDAVVLYPTSTPLATANALNVQLAPGNNGVMLTVTNVDNSTSAAIMASLGYPVSIVAQVEATTSLGPVQGSYSVTQQVAPGQSVSSTVPGPFVGPGQVTVIVSNQGPYTTAVILNAVPLSR